MAEFCKCGSVMINGSCTNKNCSNKLVKSPHAKAAKAAKPKTEGSVVQKKDAAAVKTEKKSSKVPRASKCITYKISDLPEYKQYDN